MSSGQRARFWRWVLVALVGALAVDALGVVAVGAEDLKTRRVAIFLEPGVYFAAPANLCPVFSAIAIGVIDLEEFRRRFLAASTAVSAVSRNDFVSQLAVAVQAGGTAEVKVVLTKETARQCGGGAPAANSLGGPGDGFSAVFVGTWLTHDSLWSGRLVAPDAEADSCLACDVGMSPLAVLPPAFVTMDLAGGSRFASTSDTPPSRDQGEAAFVAVVAVVSGVVFHASIVAFGTMQFKVGSFVPDGGDIHSHQVEAVRAFG